MNIVLYDLPDIKKDLLPITFTRPIGKILVGLLTIEQKWQHYFEGAGISFLTEIYLQKKFPMHVRETNLLINGAICPNEELVSAIMKLKGNELLFKDDLFLAGKLDQRDLRKVNHNGIEKKANNIHYDKELTIVNAPWKIFSNNRQQIKSDFKLITTNRTSRPILDDHTIIYNKENVFVEEGVSVKAAIINAEEGPVYLGKGCKVHEGAIIKGPFGMLQGSDVNMGAKIRGGSTVGPYCKVGGEVNNVVIFGYSNKGHEGFLGNSVVGEWCNFGADTNNSNLKNNYSEVRLWNYRKASFETSGLQFCGLIMGDHAKCGINTMFNTGTVVGISANVFGAGYQRNFIPSFSWGGANDISTYRLDKAIEVAQHVMNRRDIDFTEEDKAIMTHIFEETSGFRSWETDDL